MSVTLSDKDEIGHGHYGAVFKGVYNKQQVALKKMLVNDEARLQELWKEISILKILRAHPHPNVIGFLGYASIEGAYYIVTEFADIGSLLNFLEKNYLAYEPRHKALMALQICEGMRCLERLGIIHRDLALRNILVSQSGDDNNNPKIVMKVSDFGLSRPSTYISNTQSVVSPAWSAPEVISGKDFSSKADVWAFGVTMWEIFAMATPTPINGRPIDEYIKEKVDAIPNYPALFIFQGIWEEDPEKRVSFDFLYNWLSICYRNCFCRSMKKEEIETEIPLLHAKPEFPKNMAAGTT